MAQFARPNADDSAGNWTYSTGSTLYQTIDESSASDSDYMYSYQPQPADDCVISLSTTTDPATGDDHRVRFRCRQQNRTMDIPTLTVELYEGATPVTTVWAGAIMHSSWTTYDELLDSSDVDNYITDYSDLALKFTADGYNLDAGLQIDVSWAELEVPSASGGSGRKVNPLRGPFTGLIG